MNFLYKLTILLLMVSSVAYGQTPSAAFVTESHSICEAQSIDLVIELIGEAPFAIQYTNGSTIYMEDGDNDLGFYPDGTTNTKTITLTVSNTTTFEILKVWDKNTLPSGEGVDPNTDPITITVNHKPTISTGTYSEVCGVSIDLAASSDIAEATYLWTSPEGSFDNPTSLTPTFSTAPSNIANTYSLTLTAQNGACKDANSVTATVDVTLKGNPSGTVTEGDENFCAPQSLPISVNLQGSPDINGTYSFSYQFVDASANVSSNFSSNTLNSTSNILTSESTTYQLYYLLDNNTGCTAVAQGMSGIKNYNNELPNTNAGEDQIICGENRSYTLQGSNNSGTTGVWSGTNNLNISESTNPNANISSNNYQKVTLTWTETTANLGCVNSDEVEILFSENPTLSINKTTDEICESSGTEINLTATGNAPWTVNYTYTGKTYTEELTTSNQILTFDGSNQAIGNNLYSFFQIQGNNGCTTTYSDLNFDLNVDELPYPNAGADDQVCSMEVTLNAVPSAIGTGHWEGPGSFDESLDPNTTFVSNNFGIQTLTWVETNGQCTATDAVEINFQKAPYPFGAGNDTLVYATDTLSLNATELIEGIGTWSVISGTAKIDNANNPKTLVYNLTEGTHVFNWTATISESVCPELSQDITIIKKELFAPTGFSPGGNGFNDSFKILGADNISDNELTVFDKNGKLVYSTKNYQNDWTGFDTAGSPLPAGVYYYVFEGDQLSEPVKNYLIIKYDN